MTDDDIMQAEYEAEGNRVAALRKRGICTHEATKGYMDGSLECSDCGSLFASWEAYLDARHEAMGF